MLAALIKGTIAIVVLGAAAVAASLFRNSARAQSTIDFPDQVGSQDSVIIGSHHKTGTVFAFSTFHALSKHELFRGFSLQIGMIGPKLATNKSGIASFYFNNNAHMKGIPGDAWLKTATVVPLKDALMNNPSRYHRRPAQENTTPINRFIHLIRDPVEMVVSAYLYHLQKPENEMWWLDYPGLFRPSDQVFAALYRAACPHGDGKPWSWLEILECLPPADGIVAEGWKMIDGDIEPMATICEQVDCIQNNALKLDIDDISRNFTASMGRVFEFLNVTEKPGQRKLMAALVQKQKAALLNTTHVTAGKFDKSSLRRMLADDLVISERLSQLRRKTLCMQ